MQPHEHALPHMNIEPVKLKLQCPKGKIKPTPQMRERRYKKIDIEAIETFVELGLRNGLLVDVVSPVQNPLHCVRTEKFDDNGNRIGTKTRITADCRKNNSLNCGIHNYAFQKMTSTRSTKATCTS